METETEMGMGVEAPLKRDHTAEVQEEEEAAKKRKIELDAEEFDGWLDEVGDEEMITDPYAYQASQYRNFWDLLYHNPTGLDGSFEDETTIRANRFTDEPPPRGGRYAGTLQIFSVKVAGLRGGLQWPLDVYGMVAIRDSLDHNRNIIFQRKRDNCQTLTQEDPSLVLIGPIRAVRLADPPVFEVELKVKEDVESEDKVLSFLASQFISSAFEPDACLIKTDYTSKLSTLEFTVGHIFYSLEATISVKVIKGSWRDDFHVQFAASITTIKDEEVVLLDFGDVKVPLDSDSIPLARSVVSADSRGQLIVSVKTRPGHKAKVEAVEDQEVFAPKEDRVYFTPLKMSRSCGELNVGFCKMEVTVAWSLFA